MVQEKQPFSVLYVGCIKNLRAVFIGGNNLKRKPRGLKRSYMVMQDVNYELFADRCRGRVFFWYSGIFALKLVEKTLDELGLLTVRDRHPNTLSGGQKQRVAVAVSMICGKEVLVFDEPTLAWIMTAWNRLVG